MGNGRISAKQSEILEYIKEEILNKGYPPAVREICNAVHLKSTSSVHSHLETLEKNGYIRRDPTKPRAIEIVDDEFNLARREVINVPIVGTVTCGEPILAEHNLIGDYNLDPNLNFVGLAADGGFAKYCVLDGDLVHVIPDSLSYEQAALTEPAAVAVYAVRQSALKAGDTAVIFGLGPIGLLIVEALRAAGASKIYAVELSPERQAKAEELGIAIMGPNCAGYVNYIDNVQAFAFISDKRSRKGSVGVISQSGQLCLSMMDHPAMKFSYNISACNSKKLHLEYYM